MSTQQKQRSMFHPLIVISACVVLCMSPLATNAMITKRIIERVFPIKWTDSSGREYSGTAFTVDRRFKQYLITARHVVEGIRSGDSVEILQNDQWKKLVVNVAGFGEDELDLAVLVAPFQLSPPHPLDVSSKGLAHGQKIFFLGYPYTFDSGNEHLNRGIPIPFVKSGVVGAMKRIKKVSWHFLDADVNHGFSGGPLLFVPLSQLHATDQLRVAGVITNHVTILRPVVDLDGQTVGHVPENPGIGQAIDIHHVLEIIDANPTGFQLHKTSSDDQATDSDHSLQMIGPNPIGSQLPADD